MKIVNGFVCQTCCDERVAKRGIDPRNPHEDPVRQQRIDEEDALKGKPPKRHGAEPTAASDAAAVAATASLPGLGRLVDILA